MKDLPLDKLMVVTQSFHAIRLLSEFHAADIYTKDDVPTVVADEIAASLAIIADRMRVATATIDETYPGFAALVEQEDKMAEQRARQRKAG